MSEPQMLSVVAQLLEYPSASHRFQTGSSARIE